MTKQEVEQLNTLLGKAAQVADAETVEKIIEVLKSVPKLLGK